MNRISRNLSIILRSERLIAQRQLAILRRQTGLIAAAGVVAALGIIMLNVSAYLALADNVSQPAAALIVAIVNIALACILIAMAGKSDLAAETAPVAEVRDLALEDLEAEIQLAAGEVKAAMEGIKSMARDPFGSVAPGLAGAIAKIVIKNLKS